MVTTARAYSPGVSQPHIRGWHSVGTLAGGMVDTGEPQAGPARLQSAGLRSGETSATQSSARRP